MGFDNFVGHMGNSLGWARVVSSHGLSHLQVDHVGSMRVHWRRLLVNRERSYTEQSAADLLGLNLEKDRFGRREEVRDSLDYNERKGGCNAGAAHGHSPGTLRGSPHFRAVRMEVVDVLLDEGDDALVPALSGDERMDGVVLLLLEAPPLEDVAGLKFEASMQNPRAQCRRHTRLSSCPLVPRLDRGNRDFQSQSLETLDHRSQRNLLRRLSRSGRYVQSQSDRSVQNDRQWRCGRW